MKFWRKKSPKQKSIFLTKLCIIPAVIALFAKGYDNVIMYAVAFVMILCLALANRIVLRCSNCGRYVRNWNDKYCPHCGKPVNLY